MKRILAIIVVLFVAVQFVRPAKNVSYEAPSPNDLLVKHTPPSEVRRILERACYDCHSNHTRYPWYAEIQPSGWFLAQHVSEGKRFLNFSEFGKLTARKQRAALDAMVEEVESGEMPLKSYTWIHKEARLTKEEVAALVSWCETVSEEVE